MAAPDAVPDHPFTASPEALAAFVEAWEAGRWPRSGWTHAAHVAVGACYAIRFGDEALARLRAGIRRYNAAVGVEESDTSGYHETLTRFWAALIAETVGERDNEWQAACRAVGRFGARRDLHTLYYSFDVVRSVEARRGWIPPDVRPALT